MAVLNNFNFLFVLLILFSVIAHYVNSHRGLSLPAEHAYNKRYMVEENICHPLGRKKDSIKIGENLPRPYNSSIILSPGYEFDRWINRTSNLICKFVIKVRKGEHLMAVIQNIAFRKNGSECIDYVTFRRKDQHKTDKFCGEFDRQKTNNLIDYNSKIYGDYDIEGEIETTIFVNKQSLHPDERPLNLTIVYTPYKSKGCNRPNYDNTINFYRFFGEIDICLAEDYFCDGIHNCIPAICADEKNCDGEIFSNGTGSKVTIGAVTTILLGFIIFVIGLWICRRHKRLCWSADCAGPDANDDRFNNNERSSTNAVHRSVPTAPMLEVSVLSSATDKDLPPSYDSLFPQHSNPSST
ncbi:hypothetical protein PV327_008036 [Microctonus hyperodae]|uniref:CUB domain-containing protein n=1 Tax=Microctonus hyperodae TaxID=165561 RepID=A0AA39G0V4_MICHY|nr:hypothetical protein PV327_008036 [Microctonus hyperodae]